MSYRIVYNEMPVLRGSADWRQRTAWSEDFTSEHQALGRARELLARIIHEGSATAL